MCICIHKDREREREREREIERSAKRTTSKGSFGLSSPNRKTPAGERAADPSKSGVV